MFATEPVAYSDIDAAEQELVQLERVIARARARQLDLISWLDAVKVARVHGSRSLEEWTAAHLDVTPATARRLVTAARARADNAPDLSRIHDTLDTGEISFDRAVATTDLAAAGGGTADIEASLQVDLTRVRRQTARFQRITRIAERDVVRRRHLTIEPTLGESAWRIHGLAPGYDGTIIARALERRADCLPAASHGERETRSQRMLTALTALANDYLDGKPEQAGPSGRDSSITLFIDHTAAAPGVHQLEAQIASGPRVGPDTIERILCEGSAAIVALDGGRPVTATQRTRTVPPATRAAVLNRDGGCVIDGCRSRYRLQPHHITPRSRGGTHHPDNLATLCWYHHHVAIHGYGKLIDPASPPLRRRFYRRPSRDPP